MSRPSIHISIPQPCHENWGNMDATERGAFCHSCKKEVIDFSAMTDREVIEYLERHKTGCGRFRADQLDTPLTIPKVENGIFKWRALLLSLLPVLAFKTANASQQIKQTNSSLYQRADNCIAPDNAPINNTQSDSITIKGKVIDEDGYSLIGANIILTDKKGNRSRQGTTADIDGNFTFTFSRSFFIQNYTELEIMYIGYESKQIQLSKEANQYYLIKMDTHNVKIQGEMIIVNTHHKFAHKIKYWFRRTFKIQSHKKATTTVGRF